MSEKYSSTPDVLFLHGLMLQLEPLIYSMLKCLKTHFVTEVSKEDGLKDEISLEAESIVKIKL